ncbi:hypothetical protein GQ53DRAFT_751554 [Thozetella sp. PMI_491]|nr:hypothetical protein GQ53DRAFT_751554 [Thozetella sp. PMI_491]
MEDKTGLPPYSAVPQPLAWRRRGPRRSRALRFVGIACLTFIGYAQWRQLAAVPRSAGDITAQGLSVKRLLDDLAVCSALKKDPIDPIGLGRERNARYQDGFKPTLIKNASVWVGEPTAGTSDEDARKGVGYSWVNADVYLEYGLIQRVEAGIALSALPADTLVYDAKGRPLTSGIVDMHSHAGVDSLPSLRGREDTNEVSADITPYVRSIDGIQPNDHQIQVIKSGGVTTSLILPGSANNMGGEAFVIKHAVGKKDGRNETSAVDMLADPERSWRYMKMACGENPKRVYGKSGEHGPTSRLGESWEFRHAFEQAAALVREQDDWCHAASTLGLDSVKGYLPQEIRWESLGALLRGQVRLNTHCYTIPDLEAFVDHTNEFKFKVRAFHHAHETFLVPEILKRAWGGEPPASALFANHMWYKAESFWGSEFAAKHLYDNGLVPIFVSDNPVINAQHVLFEAAKGYKFGLPYHAALASVTTAPAERLGLGQRIGKVKPGFDADVVVWDSDPLSVGAAPVQVWIDGTAQFEDPIELKKATPAPIVPDENLAKVAEEPSLHGEVFITGVKKVLLSTGEQHAVSDDKVLNIAVSGGKITCIGLCASELEAASKSEWPVIKVRNGYLTDSLTAVGGNLGLSGVGSESSTDNGADGSHFSRAVDGLALDNKKLRKSYQVGATVAISAPKSQSGGFQGTSVGFLTGAVTALESKAVFSQDVAVHYNLRPSVKRGDTPSISSAIGALRRKLLEAAAHRDTPEYPYSETAFLRRVVRGELPLVIDAQSADVIATVLKFKTEHEALKDIRLAFHGGAESWLVAKELAAADAGVILNPFLSYRTSWDERRALTGAPLTNGTAVDVLLDAGVPTAIGLDEDSTVIELSLLAGIAYQNGEGRISEKEALDLLNTNVYKIFGLEKQAPRSDEGHFILWEGSPLEIGSRVKAVGGGRGAVSVF